MLVEVCANSLQSALNAQAAGADRIELCSELAVGGITPSYGLLKAVREKIAIPVHVLIRPRSGDFSFSKEEFEMMKTNISLCKNLGFDGIVSGVLHPDFSIDIPRTKALIAASEGLKFTFHRAFDWVKKPKDSVQLLDDLGVDYVLSSGQQKSALEGISLLTSLQQNCNHCTVLPGSGIHEGNIAYFKQVGFKAVHLSAARFQQTLDNKPAVSMNSASFLYDDGLAITQTDIVKAVVSAAKK